MTEWTEFERFAFVAFQYLLGIITGYCWGKYHD
jgi:hypothetical protein